MSELNNNISEIIKSSELFRNNELASIRKGAKALLEMADSIEKGEASSDMLAMLANTISDIAGRIQNTDARIDAYRQIQGMTAQ